MTRSLTYALLFFVAAMLLNVAVAGAKTFVGTAAPELIRGTPWPDRIFAGPGNDRIVSTDGRRDVVNCGRGRDVLWTDRIDLSIGCEVRHRRTPKGPPTPPFTGSIEVIGGPAKPSPPRDEDLPKTEHPQKERPVTVIASLATRADWGGLQGGSGDGSRIRDDFTVLPPDARFDRSIRLELRDGDIAPWQSDAEAAQVQAGSSYVYAEDPADRVYWTEFWILYQQLGSPGGGWHFVTETHLPAGGTQAPWGLDLTTTQQRIRVWTGPGTWDTVYGGATPVDLGVWHHFRIGHRISTGADGWYEVWRDDVLIFSRTGPTSAQAANWYPKIGFYRGIGGSGTDVAYIAGFQVHDSMPAYPGAPPVSSAFGVNGASSVLIPDAPARQAALADLRELAGRYVRIDVRWSDIEPTAGTLDWSFYDAVMADIQAAGLEPLMLIGYGNAAYGSASNFAPPPNYASFASFAGKVAARYKDFGHVYQVWNEPNLPFYWNGSPDAGQYADLLSQAYHEIHAADPQAVVLSAGIAPAGMTAYVTALYAAGAKWHFDGLAIHPYIGEGADSMWDVRTVMNANGDSAKKVWATEFGWSTWDTPGNSEALQSDRFTQAVGWWRNPAQGATGAFLAYTHRDTGTDPANPEHHFGLLRFDGSRKPAWTTFRDLVSG